MLDSTPEADAVIESTNRQFASQLRVDWNNNGGYDHELSNLDPYVVRVDKDQALNSTAPDELQLVEGHAAASLTIELEGNYDGYSLVGHFSPYNGRSVFYENGLQLGVEMHWSIGVVGADGIVTGFRQFTGVVREVTVDRASGVVKLDCLDFVEKLRTVADLPAYAIPLEVQQAGTRRGGLVDSSSIIDTAARSGGFYHGHRIGPRWVFEPNPIRSVLRVPLHGSLLPEIGTVGDITKYHRTEVYTPGTRGAEAYTEGHWGNLALNCVPVGELANAGIKRYYMDQSQTPSGIAGYGAFGISTWIYWEGSSRPGGLQSADLMIVNNGDIDYRLYLDASAGTISALFFYKNQHPSTIGASTISQTLPSTPGWVLIEARFGTYNQASGGYVDCQLRVNDTENTTPTRLYTGNLSMTSGPNDKWWVEIRHVVAMSDMEVIYNNDLSFILYVGRWFTGDVINRASVDWGRNRALYTKRTPDTAAWDLIKEVAAAEYGAVWFDEFGQFVFRNYESVQEMQTASPARTLTADNVEGLDLRMTMDSVRNVWTVTTKEATGERGIIYDLSSDGVPLVADQMDTNGDLTEPLNAVYFRPANFQLPASGGWSSFYVPVKPETITVDMSIVPTTEFWNTEWTFDTPLHAKKTYSGEVFIDANNVGPAGEATNTSGDVPTLQEWWGRDFIKLEIWPNAFQLIGGNWVAVPTGFWLNSKNQGRFRLGGRKVVERDEENWEITTDMVAAMQDAGSGDYQQSLARYGRRVIELGNNFWLQDKFQTQQMLRKVIEKFGRPIPVTDAITVPGDPRIQLGDVVEIVDPNGIGGKLRLQILGIKRELSVDSGLTDTYQVEVFVPPGEGIWDSDEYGRWDESLIWA